MNEFWSAFIPQLLATLVGSGAAVVAVYYGFRLQRTASSEDAIDAAVERLLVEIADFVTEVIAYRAEARTADQEWNPPKPPGHGVSVAIEILKIRTRDENRRMAGHFSAAWSDIVRTPYMKYRQEAAGHLAGAISDWRLGRAEPAVLRNLKLVSRIAEKGLPTDQEAFDEDLGE